jgi:hypothetical protein
VRLFRREPPTHPAWHNEKRVDNHGTPAQALQRERKYIPPDQHPTQVEPRLGLKHFYHSTICGPENIHRNAVAARGADGVLRLSC